VVDESSLRELGVVPEHGPALAKCPKAQGVRDDGSDIIAGVLADAVV